MALTRVALTPNASALPPNIMALTRVALTPNASALPPNVMALTRVALTPNASALPPDVRRGYAPPSILNFDPGYAPGPGLPRVY